MKKILVIVVSAILVLGFGSEFTSGIYLENKFSKALKQANNFYYSPRVEVSGSPLVKTLFTKKIDQVHLIIFPSDIFPHYRVTMEATLKGIDNYKTLLNYTNNENTFVKRLIARTSINSNTLGKFLHIPDLRSMVASRPGNTLGGPGDFSLQSQINIILSGTIELSNHKKYKLSVLATCAAVGQQVEISAKRIYTGPDFYETPQEAIPTPLIPEALQKFSVLTRNLWIPFDTKISRVFFMGTDLVLYGEKIYTELNLKQFRSSLYFS